MNIRKVLFYSGITILFIVLNLSCVIRVIDYYDSRGLIPVEDFQRVIPFSPGGTVSLRNFDGMIEILGWDRKEVEVYAEKMIPRSEEPRVGFLLSKKVMAKIDLQRYDDENIDINTKSASEKGENTIVDYYVKTPRFVNLNGILARSGDIFIADLYGSASVKLEEGDIQVDNFSGSLDVSVQIGSIQASLYDERPEDVVTLKIHQGNVSLFLQENIDADIKAVFPEGEIDSEFELGQQEKENEVDLRLGKGETSIYITASNGNIDIKKIKVE
ncbi:MAG: DUF4097 family beta strand repeat-containing protein [Acidobacteriota bacterium]